MKIKKIEPTQVKNGTLAFKAYRKVLKPALKRMLDEHNSPLNPTQFIVKTDFIYEDLKDKKIGLIIPGDHNSAWKMMAKEVLKADRPHTCIGDCYVKTKDDGSYVLVLMPEKGAAKKNLMIKQLEKFALKGTPFTIEVEPGGELVEDMATDVVIGDFALPDDSNEPEETDNDDASETLLNGGLTGMDGINTFLDNSEIEQTNEIINLPKNVLQAALNLKNGVWEAEPGKKLQAINFLKEQVIVFDAKFEALHQADKTLNKKTESEYKSIKKLLVDIQDRVPVMSVATLKTEAGGTFGFLKNDYDKILEMLGQYEKLSDPKLKHAKLQEINILIEKWDPTAKRNKEEQKRYEGLLKLQENIAPYIGKPKVASVNISIDDLNEGTAIIKEQAGSALASQRVKDVAESNIDERAKQLAILLDLGKASNSDARFGAVMKWLVDSNDKQLADKYTSATAALFNGTKGVLISDISKVFGANTLRTKFLLEYLEGDTSPYAEPALALGILGNAWFSTEANDAFEFIEKNLNSGQIDFLLQPGTLNLSGTFEGAIAKKLQGNEKFKAQLRSMKLIKNSNNEASVNNDLAEINKDLKQKYVSAADYFLCTTYLRIDDTDKFTKELKKWVSTSEDDDRIKIKGNSAFYKLLSDKTGILGLSKSTVSHLKSIIETFQTTPTGQESAKVIEQLEQIAAKQKEKNALSRWKQDKDVGEQFKKVLFNENVNSPQEAIVYKFSTAEAIAEWNNGTPDKKKQILDKAVEKLNIIMKTADIHDKKIDEILETIYSDGAKGETYNKLKTIVKAKTNIGAATDIMNALADLSPDSKEIVGIKNDIELLKALKVKAIKKTGLQGIFKNEEDDERWLTAMKKLGITSPTNEEIADAETLKNSTFDKWKLNQTTENIRSYNDALAKYELLVGHKEVLNTDVTEKEEDDADKLKIELGRPSADRRRKIMTKEQVKELQVKQTDLKKTPGYWASKLAHEYKKGFTGRDLHRLVIIANQSVKAGVDGTLIMTELNTISPNLHSDISSGFEDFYLENSDGTDVEIHVTTHLYDILIKGKKVNMSDILQNALDDAEFQRRVRLEDLTATIEGLSEAEIIKDWFDIEALKKALKSKKDLLIAADAINAKAQKTPEDTEELEKINSKLEVAYNKIMQFDINVKLLKKLDDSAKVDKVLKFKKILREKISAALIDPSKSDELAEIFGNSITKEELDLIGASLKQVSNLEYEASLETGLQWSSLSSRMLQRDLAAAKNLKEGWKGREKLKVISKLTPVQRQKEEEDFVYKLNKTNTDLVLAQEKFVETKAKYDNRYKTAVSIVLTAILGAVAAVTGVGAGPFLIQLAWTMGSTFLTTMVNEFVSKQIEGNNHRGMEDLFVNLITDQASSVLSALGAQALNKLNWEVFLIGLEKAATGGDKAIEKICASSLRTIIEAVPQQFGDTITKSFIQTINEKGSVTDRTLNDLKKFATSSVKNLAASYLKNILLNCDKELKLLESTREWLGGPFAPELSNVADPVAKAKFVAKYEGVVQTKTYEEYFKTNGINPSAEDFGMKALKILSTNVLSNLANEKIKEPVKRVILETICGKGITDTDFDMIIQNAGSGLRNKLVTNLAKHPDNITEFEVDGMELEEVRIQYAKLNIIHSEIEIADYIKSMYNFDEEIWNAYSALTKLDVEKSLEKHAGEFLISKESLESSEFRSDIMDRKIFNPYLLPNPNGGPTPLEKQLDLTKPISEIFTDWNSIQNKIALSAQANN